MIAAAGNDSPLVEDNTTKLVLSLSKIRETCQLTNVLKRTTIMVLVIIVASIGLEVTPENVNCTNKKRTIQCYLLLNQSTLVSLVHPYIA